MAEETATVRLNIEAQPGAARDLEGALEKLRVQLKGGSDEIKGLQAAMRSLKGGGSEAKSQLDQLRARLNAHKIGLSEASARYLKLGGDVKLMHAPLQSVRGAVSGLTDKLKADGAALGTTASRFASIRALGVSAVGVLGAAAAAFVAVGAAAVTASVGLAKFGLEASGARREELLLLEGMTKLRPTLAQLYSGFGLTADKASFLQDTIDQVSGSVAIGRSQVAQYAQELYRTGLRGGNLQAALEGVALAASTQGEAGVAQFKAMAYGAQYAGGSIRKVADDFKARLGPIAARQMLSLNVQFSKLRENLGRIFGGLRLDGFLSGISKLTGMLNAGSVDAKALQSIFNTMFQPIIDFVGNHAITFLRFFRGLEIGALQFGTVLLKVRNWLLDTFGDEVLTSIFGGIDALDVGKGVAYAFAAGLTAVGVAAAAVAAPFVAAAEAIGAFIKVAQKLWEKLPGVARQIGQQASKGMAQGIADGNQWVNAAVGNQVNGTINAYQTGFGIHSPSRKMREKIGRNLGRGQAEGIKDSETEVQRAVASNVNSTVASAGGAAVAARNSQSVSTGDIHVHVGDIGKHELPDVRAMVVDAIRDAIVGAATKMAVAS